RRASRGRGPERRRRQGARARELAPHLMEAHAETRSAAATSSWAHFLYVTRALTATEFKLRYFGSVLGYLWTLLRPLMLFGALYVVFTQFVRFGHKVLHYPVVLLAGIVIFNCYSAA